MCVRVYVCMYIVFIGHKFSAKSQKTFSGSQCSSKQGNGFGFYSSYHVISRQAHARKERICVV